MKNKRIIIICAIIFFMITSIFAILSPVLAIYIEQANITAEQRNSTNNSKEYYLTTQVINNVVSYRFREQNTQSFCIDMGKEAAVDGDIYIRQGKYNNEEIAKAIYVIEQNKTEDINYELAAQTLIWNILEDRIDISRHQSALTEQGNDYYKTLLEKYKSTTDYERYDIYLYECIRNDYLHIYDEDDEDHENRIQITMSKQRIIGYEIN